MARTKSVTPEALAALGAEALAQVLISHAATDPVLRKKLGMRLAGTEGPGKLAVHGRFVESESPGTSSDSLGAIRS